MDFIMTSIPLRNPVLLRWAVAAALAASVSLSAVEAQAQAAAPPPPAGAQIQATTYAPIPAGSAFEVQANDDSELTQEAVGRVNEALPNQGYAAQEGAGLVMVVETNLVRGQKQDDPLGQVHADNDGADVQARLFSTSQNSLLNPQQPIGSADRLYRVNISVYDRQSGLYVWRGSAMRNDPNLDVAQATSEMVSALVAGVGKSLPLPGKANP
jgi:hypothetical protein